MQTVNNKYISNIYITKIVDGLFKKQAKQHMQYIILQGALNRVVIESYLQFIIDLQNTYANNMGR